jgi:hypothetical protein
MGAQAWERDERFGNVPFFNGRPMQMQKRPMSFATAAQVEIRLKGEGWFHVISSEELDERATKVLQRYRGPIAEYSGVRDERYFLISIQPDVMVVAPFQFELKYKTAEEMRGLAERVTSEVFNPIYRQLVTQQSDAIANGLASGLLARLPGPNYAEIGCAFPDMPNAVLLAPSLSREQVVFDEAARARLAGELGIIVQRHPRLNGYWQIARCPT